MTNKTAPPTEFSLATLKHDLLTPVNAIIGYSELIFEELEGLDLTQPQGQFGFDVRRVSESGRDLLDTIRGNFTPEAFTLDRFRREILHTIRVPLAFILSYSEMLVDDAAELGFDHFIEDLEKIRASAKHLQQKLIEIRSSEVSIREQVVSDQPKSEDLPISPVENEASILVVDDNPQNVEVLSRYVKQLGHKASAAMHGRKALEMVKSNMFDAILLDVMMPDLDGYYVLKQLKTLPDYQHVPVIMISALDQIDSVIRCIEMGAEDYLSKPFDPILLKARLEACLDKKRLRDQEILYLVELEARTNEARSLLRVLSHDIINHIFVISGYVRLQKMNNDFSKLSTLETFSQILQATDQVTEIVESVRRMRSLDDGKSKLELMRYSVGSIIDIIYETFIVRLEEKKIELVFDPENVPNDWQVFVDPTFFNNTIVSNLISNAIKFSNPRSTIRMCIDKESETIVIKVIDQGIGMPPAILDNLFRSDVPTTQNGTLGEEGTGFGMPLVKRFVEAMDGTIKVESEAKTEGNSEHGTTVTLRFPIA